VIVMGISAVVTVMVTGRMIEILIYMAIAPLPLATLPHSEMSSIAKNFLKNFSAVCIQGVLLFIVIAIYPIMVNSGIIGSVDSGNIMGVMLSMLGNACVLVTCVFMTGKWSKSICNAM
ncbi:MAG: hypothetical protein ACRCZK_03345, partial [Oscillospiraceae bacterium]